VLAPRRRGLSSFLQNPAHQVQKHGQAYSPKKGTKEGEEAERQRRRVKSEEEEVSSLCSRFVFSGKKVLSKNLLQKTFFAL
jgi:hypothetical protein